MGQKASVPFFIRGNKKISVKERIRELYNPHLNFFDTVHFAVKWRKNNAMALLESAIPKEGKIVDLGCGHGFLSNYLVETSSGRKVIGIDVDTRKIRLAKKTVGDRDRVSFECKDVAELKGEYDVIVLYDVIHHISYQNQKNCLEKCYKKLRKGGQLVIKDVNKEKFLKYFIFCYLVDVINSFLGITQGEGRAFHTIGSLKQLLTDVGFKNIKAKDLEIKDITPHLLVMGFK